MKNFLNISDLNENELRDLINFDLETNTLSKKNIGLIFEKYSTRTRLSFKVAISNLNCNAIDIRMEELNISRDESFEDTFKAMNCYLDGLIYRTDDHNKLIKAASYFQRPIINALSNLSHPCQIISDLYTINEHFKTLNSHILWIGDMNNVCFSLIEAANLINELKLIICTPRSISKDKDWKLNSNISIIDQLRDIDLSKINCVMTDVFVSMNDVDSEEKIDQLKQYTVTNELISKTADNSIFMHCLPANVGQEVSEEVFRGKKSIVWKQAYNRMVGQEKLLQFIYQ